MKPGMEIIDEFLLQPHHFLSKPFSHLRKVDQFCDCSGPKYMCVQLSTGDILFQSQYWLYWLIMKVHEAWNGNHGQFSSPTSPFSAKPALILEGNGLVLRLCWSKTYVCMVVDWQFKFNISSLSRFMKPRMVNIGGFLLQPCHFLSNKSPF